MSGFGVVKAVLSGDTIVVVGAPKSDGSGAGVLPELQLSLSHVTAPRLSRHPEQKDEAFGWQSREFLRGLIIGRQVKFRVDYRVDRIGRSFATVWMSDEAAHTLNIAVASAGWGRVTAPEGLRSAPPTDGYDALLAAGREAEAEGRGIFDRTPGAAEASVRNITWNVSGDASFLAGVSGAPLAAVIEQVRDGSSFRAYLHASATVISFNLAGLQCPRVPAQAVAPAPAAAAPAPAPAPAAAPVSVSIPSAAGARPAWGAKTAPTTSPLKAAPAAAVVAAAPAPAAAAAPELDPTSVVALEAKAFVEIRLLNRDVTLYIGGADKYGNLFGRLEHPAGDIAVELLRNGFAKMVDWSLSFTTAAHAGILRAAERVAKGSKLRLWSNYVPVEFHGEKHYSGRVVEVVSGDTLVVLVPRGASKEERRVSLASVRAPRMGNPRAGDGKDKDQPYAFESKEYMRRLLIGRDVDVTVDYSRKVPVGAPGGDGDATQERLFGTVKVSTKKGEDVNVAVQLVTDGYAEVVRHRADEERASAYDELLVGEEAAKAAKRNVHSGKEPAPRRITDLTSDASKAKAHFSFLERERCVSLVKRRGVDRRTIHTLCRTLTAIVEHVFAGGRVKAFIPSQNCSVMFGIAAVRCPATAKAASKGPDGKLRPGRDAEPLGPEAFIYMRENVMQQEVEIEANSIDANGTVLGPMWIGKGGARKSVGADLLRRGLAYGIYPVIERVRDSAELMAAEAEAKAAKCGVWEHYVEPAAAEDEAAAASAASAATGGTPGVTYAHTADIVDGTNFFLHFDSDAAKLAAVQARMSELLAEFGTQSAMVDIKKGKEQPGTLTWFRARIDGKAKDATGKALTAPDGLELHEVTYIDYGNKDRATVQRMRPLDGPFATLPALAHECTLALVRVPALSAEHGHDAARTLSDMIMGSRIGLRVHSRDGMRSIVSVWSEDDTACVNEELILAGLARISRTEARRITRRASPDEKDVTLLRRLEAAQESARKRRVGMFAYGDVGDSDDERPFGAPARK